jgi:hypothetical protein
VRFLCGPFDARCFTFVKMVGRVAIAQQINRPSAPPSLPAALDRSLPAPEPHTPMLWLGIRTICVGHSLCWSFRSACSASLTQSWAKFSMDALV